MREETEIQQVPPNQESRGYLSSVSKGINYLKDASQDIAESVILIRDLHLGNAAPDDIARHRTATRNTVGGQVSGLIFRIVGVDEECAMLSNDAPALSSVPLPSARNATKMQRVSTRKSQQMPPLNSSESGETSPCTSADWSPRHRSATCIYEHGHNVEIGNAQRSRRNSLDPALLTKWKDAGFHATSPYFEKQNVFDEIQKREPCDSSTVETVDSSTAAHNLSGAPSAPRRKCCRSFNKSIKIVADVFPLSPEKGPPRSADPVQGRRTPSETSRDITSNDHPHNFAVVSLLTPFDCDFCRRFIWGVRKQGRECTECHYLCHERCRKLVPRECGVTQTLQTAKSNDDGHRIFAKRPKLVTQKNHNFELAMFLGPTTCVPCNKTISYMARLSWKCKFCGVPSHGRCIQDVKFSCPNVASCKEKPSAEINGHEVLKGGVLSKSCHPIPKISSLLSEQKIRARRNSSAALLNVGVQKYMRIGTNAIGDGRRISVTAAADDHAYQALLADKKHRPLSNKASKNSTRSSLSGLPSVNLPNTLPQIKIRGHALVLTGAVSGDEEQHDGEVQYACDVCHSLDSKPDRGTVLECRECGIRSHVGCTHSLENDCLPNGSVKERLDSFPILPLKQTPSPPALPIPQITPIPDAPDLPPNLIQNITAACRAVGGDIDMPDAPLSSIGTRSPLTFTWKATSSLLPVTSIEKDTTLPNDRGLLVLEDLVIEETILGSGQFGVVKRGYYKATKERVAIKCVEKIKLFPLGSARNPLKPGGPVGSALERELTILKRCNHPGIIRLHHAIDSPSTLYLVMDLVTGGDLLEYIMSTGCIVEDEAKFFFHQVCVAVRYLHKRGIVHRDLKPENILLSIEDNVKRVRIADFGFAALLGGQRQQLHSVIGTPNYMAPEIVDTRLNVNGYDQAADLWSLGVILYVMLGGVFPFETDRPIIDQIKAGEFFFPDAQFATVSDSAIDLCCNLLVVDPLQRFTVDQALAHPWLKVQSQMDFAR